MDNINKWRDSLIEDAFEEAKKRIAEHKLTVEEVAENINADPKLVHVLFSNPKVIEAVSGILLFSKVRFGRYRVLNFTPYTVYDNGNSVLKIRRNILPVCHVYYDKSKQEFYNFKEKVKGSITKNTKGIYIQEMIEVIENLNQ